MLSFFFSPICGNVAFFPRRIFVFFMSETKWIIQPASGRWNIKSKHLMSRTTTTKKISCPNSISLGFTMTKKYPSYKKPFVHQFMHAWENKIDHLKKKTNLFTCPSGLLYFIDKLRDQYCWSVCILSRILMFWLHAARAELSLGQ